MYRYFKRISNTEHNFSWKSKALSDESIKPPSGPNNILNSSLDYLGFKTRVIFIGSCLKQDKITFNHKTIVNVYIVYEIDKNLPIRYYPTKNILLGAVISTKHIDID